MKMGNPIKYITLKEAEKTDPGCTVAFEQHISYEIDVLSGYRETPFTREEIRNAYMFYIDEGGMLVGVYASFNHLSQEDKRLLKNSDPVSYWGPKDGWCE
jgi:uncharacterized protein (AIM24 family)